MTEKYDFSIVVFAKDTSKLYQTYRNIRTDAPGAEVDGVQILAVCTEGTPDNRTQGDLRELEELGKKEEALQAEEQERKYGAFHPQDPRFSEMLKDSALILIDGRKGVDIRQELQEKISGKYVIFVRAGVCFSAGGFSGIRRCFQTGNRDVVVTKIKGKSNRFIKAHNDYCDRFRQGIIQNEDILLLHQMYPGYTFLAEEISWPEEIRQDIWYLDVMAMVCQTMIFCRNIGVSNIHNTYVEIAENHFLVEEWWDMLHSPERVEVFYEEFLKNLAEYRQVRRIIFGAIKSKQFPMSWETCRMTRTDFLERNADYVLLYYFGELAELIYKNPEESSFLKYEKDIDRFLRQLESSHPIEISPYLSKENKEYLIRKYFPDSYKWIFDRGESLWSPNCYKVKIKIFQFTEEGLHCEFSVTVQAGKKMQPFMLTKGKQYEAVWKYTLDKNGWCREDTGSEELYLADIPYKEIKGFIGWGIRYGGQEFGLYNVSYEKYTPFTERVPLFLKVKNMLLYPGGKPMQIPTWLGETGEENAGKYYKIYVKRYHVLRAGWLAWKRDRALLREGKPGKKAVVVRLFCKWKGAGVRKQIWLFSDRVNRGDDNGEVMFRYLAENPDPNVEPYFLISQNTPEYEDLSKVGKVVEPFSWKHKILFLLNELSLSSQANMTVVNPFGGYEYLYRDLIYNKKLVFLQHGVTKDDQSKWLNKYNRNLFGFVVSTKQEYDSVFSYDYYYPKKNVWLTGMPRYDRLIHDERRYVTVMPTWRKSLSSGTDERGVWKLGKEFQESEYFSFYNELLNNKKLLEAAGQYGYTICFMPHPNTIDGIHLFHQDPRVKFMELSCSYRDIFAWTDLMVTDYSSVAFDFAYLRKPIIYAQFDRDSFFNGSHSYTEGYFDYERDGFGEVEETLEGTVERIIQYMSEECRTKEKYLRRMDATFAFSDRNCCRRVYEKIKENR